MLISVLLMINSGMLELMPVQQARAVHKDSVMRVVIVSEISWAGDVWSGVESKPGVKDLGLIAAFLAAAKAA